ncbi:MAG: CotH kinase family protein [Pseudomonadota bacterium]|nr:CotH kinase family protein [Pseudomonadota bacterium]
MFSPIGSFRAVVLGLAIGCAAPATGPVRGFPPSGEDEGPGVEVLPGLDDTATPVPAPGDALFRDDAVVELVLTLAPAAWDTVAAAPTQYVTGTLSDGTRTMEAGVRLKGATNFRTLDGKPSWKISIDRTVESQRWDGLEGFDLINELQDPSALGEAVAYRIYRSAGLPASRTGFAHLVVNGLDYGLYTVVEQKDDVFVDRWWGDDDEGSLYESSTEAWPCDFDDPGADRCDCFEQDEFGTGDDRSALLELCATATDTADAEWLAAIRQRVDWEPFLRGVATEIVIGSYDSYAGYRGNFYLYHAPEADTWSFVPSSMNVQFGSVPNAAPSCGTYQYAPTDYAGGLLVRRCWADDACAEELDDALTWSATALQASDVDAWIVATEAMIAPYAEADTRRGYTAAQFEAQVACIRSWLADRPAAFGVEDPEPCIPADGDDITVDTTVTLTTNHRCDRDTPEAPAWRVTTFAAGGVTLPEPPEGLASGDEALLIALQGPVGAGTWELVTVAALAGADVTFASTLGGGWEGVDPADHAVLLQRVPRYGNVTIGPAGVLTGSAWDGESGGVLALRATGAITVAGGGRIDMDGRGYAGGGTGPSYNADGYQGESYAGAGAGGTGSELNYNEAIGAWAANRGGGGANIGGGGGEHAGGATDGTSWNGTAHAPEAGIPYGQAELTQLFLGSGGGGVANITGAPGPGGAGGGIVLLFAGGVDAEGPAAVTAAGADARSWTAGTWTYGAGGGAGGSIGIRADDVRLGARGIVATGGVGYVIVDRPGGDGGDGRIRVDCTEVSGAPCTAGAFDGLTDPAVGWVGEAR